MRTILVPSLFCLLLSPAAWASKAHVHGTATLNAAVDGSRLTLELEAPLEDLVGFERVPANDKERAAVEAMSAYFKSGKAFIPSAAANCRLGASKVETVAPEKGHAELQASFTYECADASALKEVEVALFQQFKRLKRIDARVATGKKQAAVRLTPQKRSLGL